MRTIYLVLLIAGIIIINSLVNSLTPASAINNFDDCVSAGNPILETYPEQCRTPDGRSFTKEVSFCGWSTNATCINDTECVIGGCSSQVCHGINEEITTTCEYRDCYEPGILECKCISERCSWG